MVVIPYRLCSLVERNHRVLKKVVFGSGIGLGIASTSYAPSTGVISCSTHDGEMASALQAVLNRMVVNEVNRQIKLITEAEGQNIHNTIVGGVSNAMSEVLPGAILKAKQTVMNKAREKDFSGPANQVTSEVREGGRKASDKAWWTIHNCIEYEITQKRLEAEITKVLSEDPAIQRLLGEHVAMVRADVRQMAETHLKKESFFSNQEQRYQHANKTALSAEQHKCDAVIDQKGKETAVFLEKLDNHSQKAIEKVEKAVETRVQCGIDNILSTARLGQFLNGVAFLGLAVLIGAPYAGVQLKK